MKKRIVGKYWQYGGNSSNGRDQERKTPQGYTLSHVALVAAIADDAGTHGHSGEFAAIITAEEAQACETIHHKGDDFGREITVKAPRTVWEKAKAYRAPQ